MAEMTIKSYKDAKLGQSYGEMTFVYSPPSLAFSYAIEYNNESVPNTTAPEPRYRNSSPETMAFELLIDGTQFKPVPEDVYTTIEQLKERIYYYIGDTHQPPYVLLSWGRDFTFEGRLKSMEIKHTLFDEEGKSLRAKVNLSFIKSLDSETESKKRGPSSPDLTHRRTVLAGDTLPLMCKEIYGDAGQYLNVARLNGIPDFRNLEPGMEISFPPIK